VISQLFVAIALPSGSQILAIYWLSIWVSQKIHWMAGQVRQK